MMNAILELLISGKTLTIDEISRYLGISAAMVEAQIEYLEQSGYLRRLTLDGNCGSSCSSCKKECDGRQGGKPLFTAWEKI